MAKGDKRSKQKTGQATGGIEKSPARRRREADRRRREEESWAARSGPVIEGRLDDEDGTAPAAEG